VPYDSLTAERIQYPPAPDGFTIYAVGDIHGRLDLLTKVHDRIDADKERSRPEHTLEIYLGDYIDRGPDPAGVVSCLIERARNTHAAFLRGNHEQHLLDFLNGEDCLEWWRQLGGTTTMLSYGVEGNLLSGSVLDEEVRKRFSALLPSEHRRFLEQTRLYMQIGQYVAVHAGVRPGVRLEDQRANDLLSIRGDFLRHAGEFGFVIVHGHTPVMEPDMRSNRINIDTGAFATNRLTCLRIGQDGARLLEQLSSQRSEVEEDLEDMKKNWRFIAAHAPGLISPRMLKRTQALATALLTAKQRLASAQRTRVRSRRMARAVVARDVAERNLHDYLARSGMHDRIYLAREYLMEAWKRTMEDAVSADNTLPPQLDLAAALAARARAYLDHWVKQYSGNP
jgi:serine/threonine protein phosphatase 1